jgi:UDP-N-acetylglucosamine--N-acetylmuramyl-(pentapeptide) pyrophosphoryl-undecaprenol N-acetylglucosamine transferase
MNDAAGGSGSVVLVGGGTAGHTSPLIATGLELRRLRPGLELTAVGTARGLETTVVPAAGLKLELIPPVPMPRRVGKDLALLAPRLIEAVKATVGLLRRTQADVVLGFGGYVSTPAYLAARRLSLPIVIHEQNVLPGLANKLAARLTGHVYTSFPQTELPHAHCIGLPMRRGITDLDRVALQREARIGFELHPELPTLLVSGGSQGALRINTAVAGAWPELLAQGIQVLHVLGPKNLAAGILRSLDEQTGAIYQPVAYVEQMTAAVGLPAVFVPYPHGNGEQALNAELVVKAGGGIMLADDDCTSAWVAEEIPALFAHSDRLAGMRNALAGVARLDAATVLASRVLEVIR